MGAAGTSARGVSLSLPLLLMACGNEPIKPTKHCQEQDVEMNSVACSGAGVPASECGDAIPLPVDRTTSPAVGRLTVGMQAFAVVTFQSSPRRCAFWTDFSGNPTVPISGPLDVRWLSSNPAVIAITPRGPRAYNQAFLRAVAPGEAMVHADVIGYGRAHFFVCEPGGSDCVFVDRIVVSSAPVP